MNHRWIYKGYLDRVLNGRTLALYIDLGFNISKYIQVMLKRHIVIVT
jgi:hypothetical protein